MNACDKAIEADLVISAGCIVTVDPERRIIRDGAVAIVGSYIAAIGPRTEVQAKYVAKKTIGVPAGLVTPGLIDVHNHPIDYLIKGLCDDTPQIVRLRDRVVPYEDGLSEEEAYVSSCATFAEMIRLGTTCFCDGAGPQPGAVARAAADLGMRGVVTRKVSDVAGPFGGVVEDPDRAIALADEVYENFHGAAEGRIRACYDIDIPSSVSDRLAMMVRDHAASRSVGIVSHLIGRRAPPGQPESLRNADIQRLEALGLLGTHVTLAHIGWVPQADVELLASSGTHIAHCPGSSLVGGNGWVTHGVIPDLVAAGANVAIGTDAAAIARTMDMVRMMQLAAIVNKDARRDPLIMNPYRVFEMATIAGAKAMGWEDRIGSLEVGKAADLVIFDTSGPNWWPDPFANPVPDLVYGGTAQDARTVIIDGEIVMEDGVHLTVDLASMGTRVRQASASALGRLGLSLHGQWPQ